MNKVFKYSFLISLCLLLACQDQDDPQPDAVNIPDTIQARELFFSTTATDQTWQLNKLTFAEPTVVAELSEDPLYIDSTLITDLYAELPLCRKDNVYSLKFEYGNVAIDFIDQYESQQERCNTQEPSFIEQGIFMEFNDSLTVAQTSFRNNTAVHQFFGFQGSTSGSGYLGYAMEWRVESLSPDSINIDARFLKRDLPNIAIQFVPLIVN